MYGANSVWVPFFHVKRTLHSCQHLNAVPCVCQQMWMCGASSVWMPLFYVQMTSGDCQHLNALPSVCQQVWMCSANSVWMLFIHVERISGVWTPECIALCLPTGVDVWWQLRVGALFTCGTHLQRASGGWPGQCEVQPQAAFLPCGEFTWATNIRTAKIPGYFSPLWWVHATSIHIANSTLLPFFPWGESWPQAPAN